jgi:hypothetical protein
MSEPLVDFRVEGLWTGWSLYDQVSVKTLPELIDILGRIDVKMVIANNYPKTLGAGYFDKEAAILAEDGGEDIYRLIPAGDADLTQTFFLLKNNIKTTVYMFNPLCFKRCFLVPAFKKVVVCHYTKLGEDELNCRYTFFNFDGIITDEVYSQAFFYQLKQ